VNVISLFAGIGGFDLGLERAGMRSVAFCEISADASDILKLHWPEVPIYDDVRTLTAARLAEDGISVDVICGGFPCQDLSTSGSRLGLDGERSGLAFEYIRLIREIRPKFVIMENSPELLDGWIADLFGPLAEIGYDAEWDCIPASVFGAPHDRERVWVVAYPSGVGQSFPWGCFHAIHPAPDAYREADNALELFRRGDVPILCDRHDGFSTHVVRRGLSGLGNAVVPQIPEMIGRAIMKAAA